VSTVPVARSWSIRSAVSPGALMFTSRSRSAVPSPAANPSRPRRFASDPAGRTTAVHINAGHKARAAPEDPICRRSTPVDESLRTVPNGGSVRSAEVERGSHRVSRSSRSLRFLLPGRRRWASEGRLGYHAPHVPILGSYGRRYTRPGKRGGRPGAPAVAGQGAPRPSCRARPASSRLAQCSATFPSWMR
jgi:hypothetical protein